MIAELEALRRHKLLIAFIVDDNLIGNKVAAKDLLRDIAEWQAAEGYPLQFFTEASLNLAEDEEMMALMVAANITVVFIGIETPNEESLRETKSSRTSGAERSSIGSARCRTPAWRSGAA